MSKTTSNFRLFAMSQLRATTNVSNIVRRYVCDLQSTVDACQIIQSISCLSQIES